MQFTDANEMLDYQHHPFEDGYKVLDGGIGYVARRTEMPGCTGEMVKWWFTHIHTTEQYLDWHETDHVWSDWKGPRDTGEYIGGTHLVHERFAGGPVVKLKINFRDASAALDTSRFENAGVSAAIYARGGPLKLPIWTSHLVHLIHDTEDGCVMRSRFWLGHISPAVPFLSKVIRRELTSEQTLSGLHQHCGEEMTTLAQILPEKFKQHTVA